MKYRLLNDDERKAFEEDFKHFLITNGVSNEEWIALNEKQDPKATELVAVFSDTVFQKVMEKMKVIELRSEKNLMVFHLGKKTIELIGINVKPNYDSVSLETTESIHNALSKNATSLEFFKQNKPYNKERELEIFEMLEKGCLPSHIDFWNMLNNAIG